MFTRSQIDTYNAIYKQAKQNQERHSLAAKYYREWYLTIQIPLAFSSATATALSALEASFPSRYLKVLAISAAYITTACHAALMVMDLDSYYQKHLTTSRRYGDVVSFLERERNINGERVDEFYPSEPESSGFSETIKNADEYMRYVFKHAGRMMDDIDNTSEYIPETINVDPVPDLILNI